LLAAIALCSQVALGQIMQTSRRSSENRDALQVEVSDSNIVDDQETSSDQAPMQSLIPDWQYGAFLDAAYLLDFNHPANDLFRSRGTAYKVDEPF